MDERTIRRLLRRGRFSLSRHAIEEAFADGLDVADIRRALRTGEVIEEYPERQRCLMFGWSRHAVPVHAVCDFTERDHLTVWTVYVPDEEEWLEYRVRKR